MKYKYRMKSGMSYPAIFVGQETASDDKSFDTIKASIGLPAVPARDLLGFYSKLVESGPNGNLTWFDQAEMVQAYDSVPYKAIDIEHEFEEVCGFIWGFEYINRDTGEILKKKALSSMDESELRKTNIDIIIGSFLFSDRFPEMAERVSVPTISVSMECFFSDYLLKVGELIISKQEAEALGLTVFMDSLLGDFDSEESMLKAHTLQVVTADDQRQDVLVYKYIKDIFWSGAGLVNRPACSSCHVLSTEECSEDFSLAASIGVKPEFTLDLKKYDPYMKEWQEKHKIEITNPIPCDCIEDTEVAGDPGVPPTEDLPPMPSDTPPNSSPDYQPSDPNDEESRPGTCNQYKRRVWRAEHNEEGDYIGESVELENWCVRNNVECPTGGDSTDHACVRWSQTANGIWMFDPDDNQAEISDTWSFFDKASLEEEVKSEFNYTRLKIQSLIDNHRAFLTSLQFDEIEENYEKAAVWSTKYVNDLPNSSFAVVEKGYKEGDSPTTARHLPFKDKEGNVDLPHLRNALARMNQIKPVLGNETAVELRNKAKRKLKPYANKYLPKFLGF